MGEELKVVAVDFDGTIVQHKFPKIGEEVPGAFEWMKKFQEAGAKLILWTMRCDTPHNIGPVLTHAVDYCKERGVEFWGVNCNPIAGGWTDSPKAYAHLYIDDAALGCPLVHAEHSPLCYAVESVECLGQPSCGFVNRRPYVDWSKVGPMVMQWLATGKIEEIIALKEKEKGK